MKKTFILIVSILSLLFFSCKSTEVVSEESTTETVAPESENITPTDEEKAEEQIEIQLQDDNKAENEIEAENIDSLEDDFPNPEDIIEPEITTLAPNDFIDQEIEINQEDEEPELELVIIEDTLPPIEVINSHEQTSEINNEQENELQEIPENKTTTAEKLIKNDNAEVENNNKTENKQTLEKLETVEVKPEEKSSQIIEDETSDNEDETEIASDTKEITPSRSVTIKRKEYVDITYPGNGWIYMGAVDGSKNLTYFGRALGTKDTTFSLQGRESGTKILHFYKNDNLKNEYLDDYIEVVVLNETGSNKTHIKAPEFKQAIPKKAKDMFYVQQAAKESDDEVIVVGEENNNKESSNKNIKNTDTRGSSENITNDKESAVKNYETKLNEPAEENQPSKTEEKNNITDEKTLLKEAQLLYNEKEYKLADEKINEFLNCATKKLDEGLYLKGQILEAKSEIQNIKNAIAAYETLTKDFPTSKYWDAANKRIIYLKRFYLEVR